MMDFRLWFSLSHSSQATGIIKNIPCWRVRTANPPIREDSHQDFLRAKYRQSTANKMNKASGYGANKTNAVGAKTSNINAKNASLDARSNLASLKKEQNKAIPAKELIINRLNVGVIPILANGVANQGYRG